MNKRVLTILAKVVDFMAFSETYTLTRRIDEWYKLHDLLEHWNSSVKDEGFMDPISVLSEEGKAFQTIWFARSVCGQSSLSPSTWWLMAGGIIALTIHT